MGYLDATPSFTGLQDVSATCILDVPSIKFSNLFSLQLDVSNISDVCANTMKLKINNNNYFQDISFSNCIVKSGHMNAAYSDQRMYKDVLRRLSFHVIGGRSSIDIFTNETEMSKSVQDLDGNISSVLHNIIYNYSTIGYKTVAEYNNLQDEGIKKIYGVGHTLLSFILDASNIDQSAYTNLSNSIQDAYINNNESLPIIVPYSFSIGNMIAIRITYTSQLENFIPVPYKCFLRLV